MTKEEKKEYNKKYKQEHKQELKEKRKTYSQEHKEELKEYDKKNRYKYKEQKKENNKRYRREHKEELKRYNQEHKEKRRQRENKKYESSPEYKIKKIIRGSAYGFVKRNNAKKNIESFNKLFGCTNSYMRNHLEKQFESWMSWDNLTSKDDGWNMDHIIPLAKFDAHNPNHIRVAFHYTNYQPLHWKKNIQKSDYVPKGFDIELHVKTVIQMIDSNQTEELIVAYIRKAAGIDIQEQAA